MGRCPNRDLLIYHEDHEDHEGFWNTSRSRSSFHSIIFTVDLSVRQFARRSKIDLSEVDTRSRSVLELHLATTPRSNPSSNTPFVLLVFFVVAYFTRRVSCERTNVMQSPIAAVNCLMEETPFEEYPAKAQSSQRIACHTLRAWHHGEILPNETEQHGSLSQQRSIDLPLRP